MPFERTNLNCSFLGKDDLGVLMANKEERIEE